MTTQETNLLDLFRAVPDDRKFAVMMTTQLLVDLPDSEYQALRDPDPASGQLLRLFENLSPDYRSRLIRYAEELTVIQSLRADPDPERPASAPAPDPDSVQTSTRPVNHTECIRSKDKYMNTELVRTAQKAVIPVHYQMTTQDLDTLYDIILSDGRHDPFNALCFAFDYGFVKGNRATRRGKVKAL